MPDSPCVEFGQKILLLSLDTNSFTPIPTALGICGPPESVGIRAKSRKMSDDTALSFDHVCYNTIFGTNNLYIVMITTIVLYVVFVIMLFYSK